MRPKLARKNEPEYYIRPSAEAAEEGPLSIEVLRDKARAGEISETTLFRRGDETDCRPLGDDAPLVADLWPTDEPFEPEANVAAPASSETAPTEGNTEHSGNVSELLRGNTERDRVARVDSGEKETGFDWRNFSSLKGVVIRWVIAAVFLAIGLRVWFSGDDSSTGFAVSFALGVGLIAVAILLTIPETLRIVITPITSFFDTLFQGSGGGKTADYWTADSLMAQGDYRLAVGEYRRIAMEHPREVQAYLKGIRAARALDNQKEVDRFREMALKNLKSDQDRNLFLNSLERMDEKGNG